MLNYYTMFVLGTTAVFYILLISRFGANSKNLLEDGCFTIIGPPIIGFILGSLIFFLVAETKTSNLGRTVEVVITSNELLKLTTDDEINGRSRRTFFVGAGYIDEVKYYEIHKTLDNGENKYEKLRADNVNISFSDTPKIVVYGKKYDDETKKNEWLSSNEEEKVVFDRKVLYVPEGTIKENYEIN